MERIQSIRGMRDLLPADMPLWQFVEGTARDLLSRFNYSEIRTPLLEPTALFARGIGEATDIVAKEMYTFADRDGESVTLRPEGTASAVRAYLEHNLANELPLNRLWYLGPMFRHERPQKGRFRQFYQLGVELLGAAHPAADAEMIEILWEFAAALSLRAVSVHLNSLGCAACRPGYREALVEYFTGRVGELCPTCTERLHKNPLRVLDCKVEGCRRAAEGAPHMLDKLCAECAAHFDAVRAYLDQLGIAYALDHRLMRGLDYYTRTTFELLAEGLGAQNAVAGGGRYDGLVEMLGGRPTPAIGFAAGLDRIVMLLAEQGARAPEAPLVFVVALDTESHKSALSLMRELRRSGLRVECDVRCGSIKSQMKLADRRGARLALILGEEELRTGTVTLKDLAAAESADKQSRVPRQGLDALIRDKLRLRVSEEMRP
ncbi:MAG: histidine--tRNA ligase [Myxococcales bacterium]|nr:histidine--tRNA ligase [Myxococcales bacterium]